MNPLIMNILESNDFDEEEKLEIEHLQEFKEETIEILEKLEEMLIHLDGNKPHEEELKEIFRAFHSIKGISGFASQTLIETIAHQTESILAKIQNGVLSYDTTILEILINSVELIKQICKDFSLIKDKKFNEIIRLHLSNIKNVKNAKHQKIDFLNDFAFESEDYIKIPMEKMEDFFRVVRKLKEITNNLEKDNVNYYKNQINYEIEQIERYVTRFKEQELEILYKKLKKIALYTLKTSGVDASIDFEGGDIRIEKKIINKLFIPFSQIIRNAITHGLLYKEGDKKIKISAEHRENILRILIENNGESINKNMIVKKLKENKINFCDKNLLNAIFLPNFSTRNQEDLISGRGVGLDIVKNEIEKLKGTISVYSEGEIGTIFKIEIPYEREKSQEVHNE